MVAGLNFSHLPNFSNLPSWKVGKQGWCKWINTAEIANDQHYTKEKSGGGKVKLKSIRVQ